MERIENRENEKKKYVYLAFGLFLLMAMVTGATYAYFALTASNNNTITGNVGGTTLSLTVTKRFPTANTNMIPQLESTLGEAISDTYSCVDDNGNVVCQVYQATVRNTGTTSAELEGVISFQNIDTLPNLTWALIESERLMGEYASFSAAGTEDGNEVVFESGKILAPNETASYYFVIWINEIGVVQTDHGTFRATINFRSGGEAGGITSTIRPGGALATQFMQNLYNDGAALTTVDMNGETATLNTTQGIMLDNNGEYRYYGASPNNYVEFNGEKWRIIGVSNVKSSESDTTGSLRMKIIRENSIGDYSWDSSEDTVNEGTGVNNWALADVNTLLNDLYYNGKSGTCYSSSSNTTQPCDFTASGLNQEAVQFIDNALWYLGSHSLGYADTYYTAERSNEVFNCSMDDGGCPRPTTWTGLVGLMYASDYLYATNYVTNSSVGSCKSNTYVECSTENWLANSTVDQWTITPGNGYNSGNLIRSSGVIEVGTGSETWLPGAIRPVVYLKDTVKIMNGEGASENPYKLGM